MIRSSKRLSARICSAGIQPDASATWKFGMTTGAAVILSTSWSFGAPTSKAWVSATLPGPLCGIRPLSLGDGLRRGVLQRS
jgi:hypothetical protein